MKKIIYIALFTSLLYGCLNQVNTRRLKKQTDDPDNDPYFNYHTETPEIEEEDQNEDDLPNTQNEHQEESPISSSATKVKTSNPIKLTDSTVKTFTYVTLLTIKEILAYTRELSIEVSKHASYYYRKAYALKEAGKPYGAEQYTYKKWASVKETIDALLVFESGNLDSTLEGFKKWRDQAIKNNSIRAAQTLPKIIKFIEERKDLVIVSWQAEMSYLGKNDMLPGQQNAISNVTPRANLLLWEELAETSAMETKINQLQQQIEDLEKEIYQNNGDYKIIRPKIHDIEDKIRMIICGRTPEYIALENKFIKLWAKAKKLKENSPEKIDVLDEQEETISKMRAIAKNWKTKAEAMKEEYIKKYGNR